ncbi:hypothetical protein M378DRAFT_163703 [Amanita muscaria Koide BX008]|uniref:Uncharacterized protein n=1 Tax=Amanita muscaria (strain Koide BX008) TaxID=946122 RepID=A0A0C2X5K8_AMAMK|nr:hypothetical protein M378DRAFT_163703 [Amanita muscaria Koide BX008]
MKTFFTISLLLALQAIAMAKLVCDSDSNCLSRGYCCHAVGQQGTCIKKGTPCPFNSA